MPNKLYKVSNMEAKNLIDSMPSIEKLDVASKSPIHYE